MESCPCPSCDGDVAPEVTCDAEAGGTARPFSNSMTAIRTRMGTRIACARCFGAASPEFRVADIAHAMRVSTRDDMIFGFESIPSFREKLAEREEATPACKALIHRDKFYA